MAITSFPSLNQKERGGRHTIEVQIGIEEITPISPALLPRPSLPILLAQEELLPRRIPIRNALLPPMRQALPITPLFKHQPRVFRLVIPHKLHIHLSTPTRTLIPSFALPLRPNMQQIHTTRRGAIHVRFISIGVPIKAWIDSPLDDLQGGAEARGQAVADRVVEVVAEDEVVAVHGLLRREAERDAVLVVGFGVRREGEVRRG